MLEGGAAAAAGGQPSDAQPHPAPRTGRHSFDRSLHKANAALLAIENAARTARQQLQTKAEAIKVLIESTGGKLELTGGIDGEVEVNVGGRVVGVSRKGLMLDQLRRTYFAHLLLYCVDALPRDEEGRPFLDADSSYVKWLSDEMALVEGADAQGEEHEIELDDTQKEDPSYSFHQELFLTQTTLEIDTPSDNTHMDTRGAAEGNKEGGNKVRAAGEGAGDGGGEGGVMDKISKYVEGYKRAVAELKGAAGELEEFGKAMGPFLRAEDGSAHEVKTVTVLRKRVSTTDATLSQLGTDNLLYKRFSSEIVQGDVPIRQTSVEHFTKVVDFARRLRQEKRPGALVKKPSAKPRYIAQLKKDVEMYGLKMEDIHRPPAPFLTFEETQEVLPRYPTPRPNSSTVRRVTVVTSARWWTSGAYSPPTKVPIPTARQKVMVAGRDASIKVGNANKRGKMAIGCGYLWLCDGSPGPADDVRSMYQWVAKEDLPASYLGVTHDNGDGTLAGDWYCNAKEIAIYHVKSG
ncbi:unnamed protein product [Vitrella brassicaformis CCMP3155]|uniref:Uncharacterized protein n=1 Tax=Vitrella brassicaformis (strain CCMP3155) TaxID=1169540 RepID=A0A0G4GI71_VITBC|nr:unnamed protein product [Vitrella brassicaformis CCMP3155]|eukprot:CEM29281.1 unnamed protein product [Vitrella brassicaformis CCMP3155]